MTVTVESDNKKLKAKTYPVIATQNHVVMGDLITVYHLGGYSAPLMVSHNKRTGIHTLKRFVDNPRTKDMPLFINAKITIQ
jgi:hypothetical protein